MFCICEDFLACCSSNSESQTSCVHPRLGMVHSQQRHTSVAPEVSTAPGAARGFLDCLPDLPSWTVRPGRGGAGGLACEVQLRSCSVSCGDPGRQWTPAGAGALGAADLGLAQALLEEVTINCTIEPPELTQDWETDSWRAQKEPCAPQDPGERGSDPTRD